MQVSWALLWMTSWQGHSCRVAGRHGGRASEQIILKNPILDNVQNDLETSNSAFSACAEGAQWETALGLLAEMAHQNVEMATITYTTAISACEQGAQWETALGLLATMAQQDVATNTITYNYLQFCNRAVMHVSFALLLMMTASCSCSC